MSDLADVTLTQYLRPGGRAEEVRVAIPAAVAAQADGMVLSCEVLMSGEVLIYGRMADWDEEYEVSRFATNGPGPRQPDLVVAEVIKAVAESAAEEREEGYDPH